MQWIETGVFDAIEKRYLKSLSLVVAKLSDDENDDERNEVLETYTFKVKKTARCLTWDAK